MWGQFECIINVPFQMTIIQLFIKMWAKWNSFATSNNAVLFRAIDAKEMIKKLFNLHFNSFTYLYGWQLTIFSPLFKKFTKSCQMPSTSLALDLLLDLSFTFSFSSFSSFSTSRWCFRALLLNPWRNKHIRLYECIQIDCNSLPVDHRKERRCWKHLCYLVNPWCTDFLYGLSLRISVRRCKDWAA